MSTSKNTATQSEPEAPIQVAEQPEPGAPADVTVVAEQPGQAPAAPQTPAQFAEGYVVPVPPPAQAATPATVQPGAMPTAADIAKEWGTWVAVGPIHVGVARAFNEGDPVPTSHPYLQDETNPEGLGWINGGQVKPAGQQD